MNRQLDGIYFILSLTNMIHESLATDEDKRNSIAVGVKMGNRFANVVLRDRSEEIQLCLDDNARCGTQPFFRKTLNEALADWNGGTNDIRENLNPEINLGENEYIPSMAQLYLILLNINEVNKALIEAGGNPMKEDWYWSSTERDVYFVWAVSFSDGCSSDEDKGNYYFVRPAVNFNLSNYE